MRTLFRMAVMVGLVAVGMTQITACSQAGEGQAFVGHWVDNDRGVYSYDIRPDPKGDSYIVEFTMPSLAGKGADKQVWGGTTKGSLMTTTNLSTLSIDKKTGYLKDGSPAEYKRVN